MKTTKEKRDRICELRKMKSTIATEVYNANRSMTESEDALIQSYEREATALQYELDLEQAQRNSDYLHYEKRSIDEDRGFAFAEALFDIKNNRGVSDVNKVFAESNQINIPLTRSVGTVQNIASVAPIIPLTIGEIIEPLEKGLILGLVGIKMQYGLTGDWQMPIVGGVEATIAGENVEIADTKIPLDKLKPNPKRVALSIPVSNSAINRSAGTLLPKVVHPQMILAVERLLNKWMFSTSAISDISGDGCFVKAYKAPVVEFRETPSWKDVLRLKASVQKAGIKMDKTAAYICTSSMLADLEATPRDAGSGRFICEDGKINGFPVFVTEYFSEDALGFGVFGYQMLGQFGEMSITVDPFTGVKSHVTNIVLNTEFDLTALRPEAFAIAKKNAALPASLSLEGGETPADNPTEGGEGAK